MTAASQSSPYKPLYEAAFGQQLLVVYFGSSYCHFCTRPKFIEAVRNIGGLLAPQATAAGRRVHLVGVAVEWEVQKGIEYLQRLGEFDEISAGGNWWNTIVSRRLFAEGRPAVPTIVLYERAITPDHESNTMHFGPERELRRLRGSSAIEAWVGAGCPIGELFSAAGLDSDSPAAE